jgi:gliding motility-associated-like protein
VTVEQPTNALSIVISKNDKPSCVNLSDGTATIVASGGTSPYNYLWSNNQITATANNLASGLYSVTVTDVNGCSTSINIEIGQGNSPEVIEGNSIDLCITEVPYDLKTLLIEGYVSGGTWTDSFNSGGLSGDLFDPSIVNLKDYEFVYTEPGSCGRSITVYVNVNDDCIVLPCSTEGTIKISKVVTANDDGFNDTFTISDVASCGFTAEVQIFNRWGKIVYQSTNYLNDWKGYHDNSGLTLNTNNKLPAGTYYYIVKIIGSGYKPITGYIYLGTH